MNETIYAGFSLIARILGFTAAVAASASLSALFTLSMIVLFAIGVELPILREIVIALILFVVVAHLGHGYQFASFTRFGLRAPEAKMRSVNENILCEKQPILRDNLSELELENLLDSLLKLSSKNGIVATLWAIMAFFWIGGTYLMVGIDNRQLIFLIVIGILCILLHGVFTYVLSELAVARIVSEVRRQILRYNPSFTSKNSFTLKRKFIILAYAFVTALVNLFAIMYVSRDNLAGTIGILFSNILVMTLLGYLVLYRISNSLTEIHEASGNLRTGKHTLIYSKALDSEFIDIVDGLNSATLSIQDHQQNLENRIAERTHQLREERDKSDKLLLNILPATTAQELKQNGFAKPVKFDAVTVIFTDFVGFTRIAESLSPEELIEELDKCFSYFDAVTEKYNLEKLKTIGDAYMCAGGIPQKNNTHALDAALASLEIQAFMNQMKDMKAELGLPYWELRLGMHCGELIAGVIGEKKFAYDVWGDTVNTASRLESSGTPGEINISAAVYEKIKYFFICKHRGKVKAKNKGDIDMYYLKGLKPAYSVNGEGRVPNKTFLEIYEKIAHGAKLVPQKRVKQD